MPKLTGHKLIPLALVAAMLFGTAEAKVAPGKIKALRSQIDSLESELDSTSRETASLKTELRKLERLMKLQALEIQLNKVELDEMEQKLQETEQRRSSLISVIEDRKSKLRHYLAHLHGMKYRTPFSETGNNDRRLSAIQRNTVNQLVIEEHSEIVALKDLQAELQRTDEELRQERLRIIAHMEDLREKRSVLNLNRELKEKQLQRNKQVHARNLSRYRRAKASERRLQSMMNEIESVKRREAKKISEKAQTELASMSFLNRKGALPLPATGQIVSSFGKKYDKKTNLYTFQKGIKIRVKGGADVKAVHPGRVVFAGRLGGYRQLVILDHGNDYYTLLGHLGEIVRRVGDKVDAGETVGRSSLDNTPLYFEIRQRHIAVNPLPWLDDRRI